MIGLCDTHNVKVLFINKKKEFHFPFSRKAGPHFRRRPMRTIGEFCSFQRNRSGGPCLCGLVLLGFNRTNGLICAKLGFTGLH